MNTPPIQIGPLQIPASQIQGLELIVKVGAVAAKVVASALLTLSACILVHVLPLNIVPVRILNGAPQITLDSVRTFLMSALLYAVSVLYLDHVRPTIPEGYRGF